MVGLHMSWMLSVYSLLTEEMKGTNSLFLAKARISTADMVGRVSLRLRQIEINVVLLVSGELQTGTGSGSTL